MDIEHLTPEQLRELQKRIDTRLSEEESPEEEELKKNLAQSKKELEEKVSQALLANYPTKLVMTFDVRVEVTIESDLGPEALDQIEGWLRQGEVPEVELTHEVKASLIRIHDTNTPPDSFDHFLEVIQDHLYHDLEYNLWDAVRNFFPDAEKQIDAVNKMWSDTAVDVYQYLSENVMETLEKNNE